MARKKRSLVSHAQQGYMFVHHPKEAKGMAKRTNFKGLPRRSRKGGKK